MKRVEFGLDIGIDFGLALTLALAGGLLFGQTLQQSDADRMSDPHCERDGGKEREREIERECPLTLHFLVASLSFFRLCRCRFFQ